MLTAGVNKEAIKQTVSALADLGLLCRKWLFRVHRVEMLRLAFINV